MIQNPEAVQTAIDALAAKLSVPAAHLYGVLTMQAKVEAVKAIAWVPLIAVAWFAWWKVLSWARKNYDEADNNYSEWGMIATVIGLTGAVALLVATAQVAILLADGVGYLVNPEFYAVRQILGALK